MTEIQLTQNSILHASIVKETARLYEKHKHDVEHLSGQEKNKKVWQLEYDAVIDINNKTIKFFDDKKYSLWLLRAD